MSSGTSVAQKSAWLLSHAVLLEAEQASTTALLQAREFVYAQQGFFYPTVAAGLNGERQKLAGNQSSGSPGVQGNGTVIQAYQNPNGPPFNAPVYYNFYTAQLSLSYVPDLFGGNRRQVESLQAQADLLQVPVEVWTVPDATALGVDALDRLGLGDAKSLAEAVGHAEVQQVIEPRMASQPPSASTPIWPNAGMAVSAGLKRAIAQIRARANPATG